jgi:hypothetical protein
MKTFRFTIVGLAALWILTGHSAAPVSADDPARETVSSQTCEVAIIDKSLTGKWADEREFRKLVHELFEVSEFRRFEFRRDALHDWIEEKSNSVVKVICLIDGWTTPRITRVDLRGSHRGKPLKVTFKVERDEWQEALRRAKRHLESSR